MMRRLGVAVLGLLGGLLTGFVLTETVAVIVVFGVGDGQLPDSLLVVLLLRSLTPVMAIAGVVLALAVDSRTRRPDGWRWAGRRRWR
jgi:hypothetical protein